MSAEAEIEYAWRLIARMSVDAIDAAEQRSRVLECYKRELCREKGLPENTVFGEDFKPIGTHGSPGPMGPPGWGCDWNAPETSKLAFHDELTRIYRERSDEWRARNPR